MRPAGVSRIVFSSTAATYAFDAEMPLREDSPQIPETPYGTTKLAAEWMIKEYARAYGLGYTILRYFNASGADPDGQYGERPPPTRAHLIPLTLQVAVGRREKLLIYGGDWETRDGTCVRDYVHTDDLAQAAPARRRGPGAGRGTGYNLGSGTGITSSRSSGLREGRRPADPRTRSSAAAPATPATLIATPREDHPGAGLVAEVPRHRAIVETAWKWHRSHPDGYGSKPRIDPVGRLGACRRREMDKGLPKVGMTLVDGQPPRSLGR